VERVAALLRDAVENATPMLAALSDDDARRPWKDGAWTRKQLLGHLVDSASNNHQRFVRAQFTDELVFPGYDQERWVEVQRYADAPWTSLVALWREFNLHLARVIAATPVEVATASRAKHNLDVIAWNAIAADQPVTLEYFMNDYVGHLEHHLSQLLRDYVPVER
jgi:hypothetical protein